MISANHNAITLKTIKTEKITVFALVIGNKIHSLNCSIATRTNKWKKCDKIWKQTKLRTLTQKKTVYGIKNTMSKITNWKEIGKTHIPNRVYSSKLIPTFCFLATHAIMFSQWRIWVWQDAIILFSDVNR